MLSTMSATACVLAVATAASRAEAYGQVNDSGGSGGTTAIGGAGTVLSDVYQSAGSTRPVVASALTVTGKGA